MENLSVINTGPLGISICTHHMCIGCINLIIFIKIVERFELCTKLKTSVSILNSIMASGYGSNLFLFVIVIICSRWMRAKTKR